MQEQAQQRRTLSRKGTTIHLAGGGWFRVMPSVENLEYADRLRELATEIRAVRGLALDAKLSDHLTPSEFWSYLYTAMLGSVIRDFGGFFDEDGAELEARLPSGDLNSANALAILLFPGIGLEFGEAMKPINQRFGGDMEIAEKNSSAPSDGISDTEG